MMQLKLEERQRNSFDCGVLVVVVAPMVYRNEDLTPELTHIVRQTRSWRRFILLELADRLHAAPLPLLAQTAEQKSENKDETMVHAHRATPLPPLVPRTSMKRVQKDEVAEGLESITKRVRFSEMAGDGSMSKGRQSRDIQQIHVREVQTRVQRLEAKARKKRIWGLEMVAEGA
ncbi:hypothetical protein LTR10_004714 [Elasticomyces elasticus]|nr:hypothetical protein LTR10_004714 [Elasticomyces elasticus]